MFKSGFENPMFGKHSANWIFNEIRLCGCNCGETFICKSNSKQRFVNGHQNRGKNHLSYNKSPSKETRKKMGLGMKGKHHKKETKKQISKTKIGVRKSEETKKRMGESRIKLW